MSVDYMTLAWRTELQAGPRLVLLAICDNANDEGNCYPSIQGLSLKSGLSVRAVRGHVADMSASGLLQRNERAGRSTNYQIDLKALRAAVFKSLSARKELSEYDRGILRSCAPDEPLFVAPEPTPADSAPRQILPPTPADSAVHPSPFLPTTPADSAAITINKPSINHQLNKERAAAPAAAFVLPDWIPVDAWDAFIETRKAKKAKSTNYALDLIVKSLAGFMADGHDPVAILNASIKGGWADVYQPKNSPASAGNTGGGYAGNQHKHAAAAATIFDGVFDE